MRRALFLTLLLLAAGTASAEVVLRVADGKVDVQATAAPLSDVLDRLARQTGMKVVYEGPVPRPLVSLSLERRTPVEALLGILEGLGLNYALQLDATGTRVQTLVMTGAASPSSSFRAPSAPAPVQRPVPPPVSAPDAVDDASEEPEEDDSPPQPAPQLVPPPGPIPGVGTAAPAGPAPGLPGGMPGLFGTGAPTTPFTPNPYSPFGTASPFPVPGLVPSPAPVPSATPSPPSEPR